jgi:hypothetical protein
VHELAEYLHARYPATFSVTRSNHAVNFTTKDKAIDEITIVPVNSTYKLPPPLVVQQDDDAVRIKDVSPQDAQRAMEISALL